MRALVAAAAACTLIAFSVPVSSPSIVWNASPSVPVGFYLVEVKRPSRGDLTVVRLSSAVSRLARQRSYLVGTDYVLKPVAATSGDRVCRLGLSIVVNDAHVAYAKSRDSADRPMPIWQGCRVLAPREIFVLSTPADSFDSRYFGPVAGADVIGLARPILTFSENDE